VKNSTLYLYSKWTSCVRYTLCDGGPSLGAKSGPSDDFARYFFLRTPSGNGNVDKGLRDLLESFFEVGKNLPPAKKIAGKKK
jgi:hypothetical protein